MIGAGALVLAAAAVLAPAAAAAQAAVEAPGRLSDEDFYRLVACAAPPGEACVRPFTRWRADRPIRVALRRIDRAFLGRRKLRADAALTRAVQALNGAEAGFHLARVGAGVPAEIEVFYLGLRSGDEIAGTGIDGFDGMIIEQAASLLVSDSATDALQHAAIAFSTALDTPDFEAAMLTQLTRAMGLATAVSGPAYEGRSVLSYGHAELTRLAPADIAALKRHYAPAPRGAAPAPRDAAPAAATGR